MSPQLVIEPNAVFTVGTVSLALGIPLSTLAKARRDGSLRFARRGQRVLILGSNLLAWLEPNNSTPNGRKNETAVANAVN